jgi:hypothetical protein
MDAEVREVCLLTAYVLLILDELAFSPEPLGFGDPVSYR